MSNTVNESGEDEDLGSGGAMVLPDLTLRHSEHSQSGGGRGERRKPLRREPQQHGQMERELEQRVSGIARRGAERRVGRAGVFQQHGLLLRRECDSEILLHRQRKTFHHASPTGASFTYPGVLPSVSANGTSNGIVWAIENTGTAVLHAFAANDLTQELYNSNQASNGRDHFGSGNKFITPMIADGKVFAATTNSVAVFGLLP